MFYRRALGLTVVALVGFAQFSCTRQKASAERLAVLPFDNLGPDVDLDWLQHAAQTAIAEDLTGVQGLEVSTAASVPAAYSENATQFLHAFYVPRNGRVEFHVSIEDAKSHRMIRVLPVQSARPDAVLPALYQIARQISPQAKPFTTNREDAFQAFGRALELRDPAEREQAFAAAVHEDPAFSTAYVAWAQSLLSRGDNKAAEKIASEGLAQHPSARDAAQLSYLAASARGDRSGEVAALTGMRKLESKDPGYFRHLGDLEVAERKFADAVRDYRQAAQLDPQDGDLFNLLGYAQAYEGDLEGARASLTEYEKRTPNAAANALDSLGEISFFLGDFRGAEKYFLSAHDKNGSLSGGLELMKAAQARMMTGDLQSADALFERYVEARKRAGDRLLALETAQWHFLTGRRTQALNSLESDSSPAAKNQVIIWKLQTGQLDKAAGLPEVISLMLAKKYEPAKPLLEDLYRKTQPSADGLVRTLLATVYLSAGDFDRARELVRLYPIPLGSGDDLFSSLVFPHFLHLKAEVLMHHGKKGVAEALDQLYRKYGGSAGDG